MNKFDISLLQLAQLTADIPRLPCPDHDKKKGRHENMFRPAIDENDIMIGAEFPAEVSGGDNSSATTAEDYDSFSSAVRRCHCQKFILGLPYLRIRFLEDLLL